MAGSLDEFEYTTDDGETYWIKADVSNISAIQPAVKPVPGTSGLPKNITPRYCLYRSADNLIQRKVVVLSPDTTPSTVAASFNAIDGQGASVAVNKTFYHGERVKFVSYDNDTAIVE